ncbi:unnamed protein product, partial [marine sediment metagenome]
TFWADTFVYVYRRAADDRYAGFMVDPLDLYGRGTSAVLINHAEYLGAENDRRIHFEESLDASIQEGINFDRTECTLPPTPLVM